MVGCPLRVLVVSGKTPLAVRQWRVSRDVIHFRYSLNVRQGAPFELSVFSPNFVAQTSINSHVLLVDTFPTTEAFVQSNALSVMRE